MRNGCGHCARIAPNSDDAYRIARYPIGTVDDAGVSAVAAWACCGKRWRDANGD